MRWTLIAFFTACISISVFANASSAQTDPLDGFDVTDPTILQPSPSCELDPCACGWCPEEDGFSSYGLMGPDPSIMIPSPSCIIDPCACGWCPEDDGNLLQLHLNSFSEESSFGPSSTPQATESTVFGTFDRASLQAFRDSVPQDLTICPVQRIRPWSIVRENYLARSRLLSCTETALELRRFEEETWLSVQVEGLLALSEDLRRTAETLYRDYSDECLIPLAATVSEQSDAERSRVLRTATAPGQVDILLSSVGRLSAGLNNHTCSAAVVSFPNRIALLTATHCLGIVSAAEEGGTFRSLEATYAQLTFTAYDGTTMNFQVDEALDGHTYSALNEDVAGVFVDLPNGKVVNSGLPLVGAPLQPWEPFLIVGENPYLAAVNRADSIEGMEHLQMSMSVTLSPDCQFRASNAGSLHYLCQTAGGMSGSPIIVVRDGRFFVAGVHTRRQPEMSSVRCDRGLATGGVNGGVAIIENDLARR